VAVSTYTRRTRVAAPLDAVWTFHSRIEGLEALTPGWANLRVEAVRGPDGEDDPAVLETGSRIRLSVCPFGVGPRQRVLSVITGRERGDGAAWFRDVMDDGPMASWEHTHSFFADGDETVVEDRVAYELPRPAGPLGPLARVGLDPLFRFRHRRTRRLLAGPGSPRVNE
jgi:ligand-binding SRPBCC domain-containing protein